MTSGLRRIIEQWSRWRKRGRERNDAKGVFGRRGGTGHQLQTKGALSKSCGGATGSGEMVSEGSKEKSRKKPQRKNEGPMFAGGGAITGG